MVEKINFAKIDFFRFNMQKKGQQNHMFIYMFSIIVAGLILVFGYFVIKQFSELSNESKLIDFRTDILSKFKSIQEGETRLYRPLLPSNIKEVCFVAIETMVRNSQPVSAGLRTHNPIIADKIEAAIEAGNIKGENFFLINQKNQIEISEYLGKIILGGPNWLCKPVINERLNLTLTGEGDGISFGNFELTEDIPTSGSPTELSFDNVIKGLNLIVPSQTAGGKITFSIEPNEAGGLTDKFKIETYEGVSGNLETTRTWPGDALTMVGFLLLKVPLSIFNCGNAAQIDCCRAAQYKVKINGVDRVYLPGQPIAETILDPLPIAAGSSQDANGCNEATGGIAKFYMSET